jgi:predicted phage terminase large subunit-like protein
LRLTSTEKLYIEVKRSPIPLARLLSGGTWKPYRFHSFVLNALAKAIAKGDARIVLNAPPRHGKTEGILRWLMVWVMEVFPERRVLYTTYQTSIAHEQSYLTRLIFEQNESFLFARVRKDRRAVGFWSTVQGGRFYATGIGGPITGRGVDLLIIDDPVKSWQHALSPAYKRQLENYYQSVLRPRLEPGGSIIIATTRWAIGDFCDFAMSLGSDSEEEWLHLKFPALAMENDLLGRKPGEPLLPERYTAQDLLNIRATVGDLVWNALYQQNPIPSEGQRRIEWLKIIEPTDMAFDLVFASVDPKAIGSVKGGSYCCIQVWGIKGGNYYLIDQRRGHWGLQETILVLRSLREAYRFNQVLIEKSALGPALEEVLRGQINVILVAPTVSKELRLASVEPIFSAGRVYVYKRTFTDEFIEEFLSFPNSPNSDQVDAMTQALRYYEGRRTVMTKPAIVSLTGEGIVI